MSTFDTLKIRGREVELFVDSSGEFFATVDGEKISRTTLKALKQAISVHLGKRPLNIPYVRISEDYRPFGSRSKLVVTPGILVSIHSGNGNYLIKEAGRDVRQHPDYRGTVLKGNTDVAKLKKLYEAKEKAYVAYNDFVSKQKLVVKDE